VGSGLTTNNRTVSNGFSGTVYELIRRSFERTGKNFSDFKLSGVDQAASM